MRLIILSIAIIVISCLCFATGETSVEPKSGTDSGFKNPMGGTEPLSLEELMVKRANVSKKAAAVLDSFVGAYSGEVDMDGVKHIAELTLNPKFMNDHYYQGLYTLKTTSGAVEYEAFTIFSFNSGSMSYLFFYFENDGYFRNYMGAFSDASVTVQSPHPSGMETIRWSLLDDGTLRHETWKPDKNADSHTNKDPDQVIMFKKLAS